MYGTRAIHPSITDQRCVVFFYISICRHCRIEPDIKELKSDKPWQSQQEILPKSCGWSSAQTSAFMASGKAPRASRVRIASMAVETSLQHLLRQTGGFNMMKPYYPLVNIQKTMENHHVQWVNQLFLWPCSIAFCMLTRPRNHKESGIIKQLMRSGHH